MRQYILHRLLLFIPSVVLVTFLVFGMVRVIPGNIVDLMLAENASGYSPVELRHRLGVDQSIPVQYVHWVKAVAHGDLGRSLWSNESSSSELRQAMPITFELGALGLIASVVVGLFIGTLAATRSDSPMDYLFRSFSIMGLAVPGFWLATLVIIFPAIWWGVTPSFTFIPINEDFLGNLIQFAIPAAILGVNHSAAFMRFTRTSMLEVMRRDYVRTARAKGLRESTMIYRHALKNALIPVVTLVGLSVPTLLSGTVILESIFALPGMGQLTLRSITQRDYPVLQAIVLFYTMVVLVSNLAVDIAYGWLDPRIRYG
jgi:peptide/nickel transport system permease protein